MFAWYTAAIAATLLSCLLYFAFFWKINWIRNFTESKSSASNAADYFRARARKIGKVPPVYPNGWFALLESSQIKRGHVKHISALGENFAVFRTEKGIVNILDAYCPHLGANMGEGGRVKGECLECPFHKWLFRGGDGSCDSIPYADKVPSVAKTKAWKTCEVNHIIFVWYHAESAEPDWQPHPHDSVSNGTWRYQGRNEFLINCHIQDVAENGADLSHLSAVHGPAIFLTENVSWFARHSWTNTVWTPNCPVTSESVDDSETNSDLFNDEDDANSGGTSCNGNSVHPRYAEKEEKMEKMHEKHVASMQLRHSLVLLERFTILELNVKVEQIGPGYVVMKLETTLGPMCILQTVTPVEPLVQRVTHVIFSPPLLAPYASLVFLGECLMFERDVAIWNHKKFERRPILVREDRTILAYRRWYSQFYSSRSPTYQMAVKSLRW